MLLPKQNPDHLLFCKGCQSTFAIGSALDSHISKHSDCVIFQVRDIVTQSYVAVWHLAEISKILNFENK